MRVLVIADDASLRESLAIELSRAGHVVRAVSDGDAALEALSAPCEQPPNVILLDLTMPDRDGQRFRVRQLQDPSLASIPTLILAANPIARPVPSLKAFALDSLLAAIDEVVQPTSFSKRCGCGRVYDEDTWSALKLVGEIDNGRDVGERLELRQCQCKSTLAWQIGQHALSVSILRIR
jgi:CheY-like chemotaxis protein